MRQRYDVFVSYKRKDGAELADIISQQLLTRRFRVFLDVRDLTPLRGMPLELLSLMNCEQLTTLEPLRGMSLDYLSIQSCDNLTDREALTDMAISRRAE